MAAIVIERAEYSPAPVRTPVEVKNGGSGGASGTGTKVGDWRVNENTPWSIWFDRLNDTLRAIIGGASVMVSGTLSPDQKPTGLGPADANNVLFYSTDKDHLLRWTGTAWQCIDYSAGTIAFKIVAPTSNGWVLCNGVGTASMMLPNGTLTTVNVPDMTGSYPVGGSAYSGVTPTAANAPGLTGTPGGTVTPFTPTGAISGTAQTGQNNQGHTHDEGTLTDGLVYSTALFSQDEAGAEAVIPDITLDGIVGDTGPESNTHDHDVDGADFTFTGNQVSPGFTGAIGTLSVDATGQPKHTTLLPYLRL